MNFIDFGWIHLNVANVIGFELIKDYNGKGEAVRAHINGSSANLVTQNPEAIARVKKLIGK